MKIIIVFSNHVFLKAMITFTNFDIHLRYTNSFTNILSKTIIICLSISKQYKITKNASAIHKLEMFSKHSRVSWTFRGSCSMAFCDAAIFGTVCMRAGTGRDRIISGTGQ